VAYRWRKGSPVATAAGVGLGSWVISHVVTGATVVGLGS